MIKLSKFKLDQMNCLVQGGEAKIYVNPNNPDELLKIYLKFDELDLAYIQSRVKYFISIKDDLPDEAVGPEDEVYVDGRFAGYSMKLVKCADDIDMITNPKYFASNNLNNKMVLLVLIKLSSKIRSFHKKGLLIGDVNGGNIMLDVSSLVKTGDPKLYFIDLVSWGVDNKFPPAAYTIQYTCPDSILGPNKIKFSIKNENYNFAVLYFNLLTGIHPFGGIYKPQRRMKKSDRMKNKLSILGPAKASGDVGVNPDIPSWEWISPELKKHFLEIFEEDRRDDIYMDDIEKLYGNMNFCKIHRVYYDGRYDDCPICNSNATVNIPVVKQPIAIKVAALEEKIIATSVFEAPDCRIILDKYVYISNDGFIVHKITGKKYPTEAGMKVEFSIDGNFVFLSNENETLIMTTEGRKISTVQRAFKSMCMVRGDYFYFIDSSNALRRARVTMSGLINEFLTYVHNAVFEVTDDGDFCVVSLYPGKAMVDTKEYRFELSCSCKYLKDYAIKRDMSSKTPQWMFIYKDEQSDEYHTWFLKDNKQSEEVMIGYEYMVSKLSNVTIRGGAVYMPDEDKIVGIKMNQKTKTYVTKEFVCSTLGVLTEASSIEFTGAGFHVINTSKEYELT